VKGSQGNLFPSGREDEGIERIKGKEGAGEKMTHTKLVDITSLLTGGREGRLEAGGV